MRGKKEEERERDKRDTTYISGDRE